MCDDDRCAVETAIALRELEASRLRRSAVGYAVLSTTLIAGAAFSGGFGALGRLLLALGGGALLAWIAAFSYNGIAYEDAVTIPRQFVAEHTWAMAPYSAAPVAAVRWGHTTILWYTILASWVPAFIVLVFVHPEKEYAALTGFMLGAYMTGTYVMCAVFDNLEWIRYARPVVLRKHGIDAVALLRRLGYEWSRLAGWRLERHS